MICRELNERLDDYLAGRLSDEDRAAFERHLARCSQCRDDLRTYRDTIELVRHSMADDGGQPGPASRDLTDAILDAWRRAGRRDSGAPPESGSWQRTTLVR